MFKTKSHPSMEEDIIKYCYSNKYQGLRNNIYINEIQKNNNAGVNELIPYLGKKIPELNKSINDSDLEKIIHFKKRNGFLMFYEDKQKGALSITIKNNKVLLGREGFHDNKKKEIIREINILSEKISYALKHF